MEERLTELIKESLVKHIDKTNLLAERIARDLLNAGVIAPPCKYPGKVFLLRGKKIVKRYVARLEIDDFPAARFTTGEFALFKDFGKTAFADYEEAKNTLSPSSVNRIGG